MGTSAPKAAGTPKLRRALGLWDLILYGLIVIQPTAPMPVYGVMSTRSHGYAVVTVLLAMVAMLFTAISYGKMASAYPSAGSAFTYVGREIHPALGYLTGWSMAMDYMLNPLICTILCSKFAMNFLPDIPYAVWVVTFATLITVLNLQGIKPRHGQYLFTGPHSLRMETASDLWRRKLGQVFTKAKIQGGHPHRFRHTFAVELLKKGVPVEEVSILLGHSSVRITEKHYASWVPARQEILKSHVAKTWETFGVIEGGKAQAK